MKSIKTKKSFTLIEAIFAIVILAFVLIGGFQIISKLYVRNYIAKETTKFEFLSQQTLDQISANIYNRIPLSVIGYDPSNHDFKYIGEINDDNHTVLEWIGYLNDAMVEANLSGFIDLYGSDRQNRVLAAKDFNKDFINTVLSNKYDSDHNITNSTAIIFAGSFDRGEEGSLNDYNDSFGWHGHEHKYIYTITGTECENNDCNLSMDENITGHRIYEKFYLADTAYAVARGENIDQNAECISNLHINSNDLNNTLFLFYNYRPWKGETYCADNNGTAAGNVTILSQNVSAFRVKKINSHLVFKITLNKQKSDINITVSKQKVTF